MSTTNSVSSSSSQPHRCRHGSIIVVGISGASRSGKSTLANSLVEAFAPYAIAICQDTFWAKPVCVPTQYLMEYGATFSDNKEKVWTHDDYECTDWKALEQHVEHAAEQLQKRCKSTWPITTVGLLIVEGFQVLYDKRLLDLMDLIYHLDVDKELVIQRRTRELSAANPYPTTVQYCENLLWPMHLRYQATVVRPLGARRRVLWKTITSNEDGDEVARQVRAEVAKCIFTGKI